MTKASDFIEQLSSDKSLTHHGVLGMKWGVRKDGRGRGGRGPGVSKKRQAARPNVKRVARPSESTALQKKRVSLGEMSNQQIQDSNQRMRLELEYKRLRSDIYKANRTKGQKFIQDVVIKNGQEVVVKLAKDKAVYAGKVYLGLPTGEKKKKDN